MEIPEPIRHTLVTLLRELIDGPPGQEPSTSMHLQARSSVAAHVDHVRYGLSLLNRWVGGEANPWATANWSESWTRVHVTDEEWTALRANLGREAHAWIEGAGEARDVDAIALGGVIGSVVHLGYHLGAIRQLAPIAAGPPERG